MSSDLEDKVKNFFNQNDKKTYALRVGSVAAIVILTLWLIMGIFIVSPAQEAVITRLGRYVSTEMPGPHWIPWPLQNRYILNVQQISTFPYQAEMLTKDENIVSVAVAVQYRIDDPKNFLFNVVNPINTLHQATSSALRQVVGQMTLNAILTTGREDLREQVKTQLKDTLTQYEGGVAVMDVALQATKPPEAVTEAFNDAVKAREDSQRYINKARAFEKKVLLSAQGQISKIMKEAEAYKASVVLKAKGDTARYNALLKPYVKAKKITADRLYLDAVSNILSHSQKVIIDAGNRNLTYLPLDKLINHTQRQTPQATAQGEI